jgi:hypothetical protein
MVIAQGLTIYNYVNAISDVWKTMYSSKKLVTNTHPLFCLFGLIMFDMPRNIKTFS